MANAPDWLWPIVSITAFLSPLFLIAYFVFRIYCFVTASIFSHYQLGLAWFFFIIEFLQLIPSVLQHLNRIFVLHRPRRPRLHLKGNDLPAVDVMVTACGEDHSTILNVVRAACESDWPKDKLNVILLDDGRSKELAEKMQHVKSKYPWAHYTSRGRPETPDYKAGNLNNGMHFSATLSDPPAPFIAQLDVDMIVRPRWLRAMMPHLLNDPKLAMVCASQSFWNIPRHDHLRQDLDFFYAVTELVHEGLGSADCVGSGYLVRREAMLHIGGFPTYSISEDTACSSMLAGHGLDVAYIEESLQCGEMPETLHGHYKQRTRWTIGNVQTAIYLNFRLFGSLVRDCAPRQRLAGFVFGANAVITSTLGPSSYVGLPLTLLSGYPFVVYHQTWQLAWLLRLLCLWVFLDTAHKGSLALFVGYRDGMRFDQADAWLMPYYLVTFIRGFILPSRLGGTRPGFVPSGSLSSTLRERAPKPSSLFRRLHVLVGQQLVWLHAAFILACALGVALNLMRCFNPAARIPTAYSGAEEVVTGHGRWVFLLTHVGWPPMLWLGQSISCWIPVGYVLWPPREVTADEALELDAKTGVRYPKEEYWGPRRGRVGRWSDHWTLLVTAYSVVAFVGSWYV